MECPHCHKEIYVMTTEEAGRKGGHSTSDKKVRTARENGKKGGRRPKIKSVGTTSSSSSETF